MKRDIDASYGFVPGGLTSEIGTCFLLSAGFETGGPEFKLAIIHQRHGYLCHGGLIYSSWFVGSRNGVVVIYCLPDGPPLAWGIGTHKTLIQELGRGWEKCTAGEWIPYAQIVTKLYAISVFICKINVYLYQSRQRPYYPAQLIVSQIVLFLPF